MPNATAAAITPEVVAEHGITPDEYKKVLKWLGREPSLTELGIFSVMWSEHCSYKSSRVHLKRLPTRSKLVVQGPGENAGIIDIGDGWACAFKIESHNHPSFIEPFQGAATGVGGILRDIFTMGARPIAVMDSLRFGPITKAAVSNQQSAVSQSENAAIHKNHSLLEGVVSGIAHYGNCFGVPNLGGETKFEECYSQNPLVNAFALGIVRRDQIFYAKAAGVGNPVIYVGAKTGRDGIHGATMASEEFSEESQAKRPNVQVGDPFLEKLLLEACLEAMHSGAVVGIQDMGAAGLTCSTCEMGGRGGVGLEIELDRVPQRETGMNAYETMLSESQERMLLVADKGREQEVLDIFSKWGLDAVEIGHVIAAPPGSEAKMRVFEHGELVAEIPNAALTDDAPVYQRPLERMEPKFPREMPKGIDLEAKRDLAADLKTLLAAPNICSKRRIHEQYDSMVQTNTVEGPGLEAGVVRIKGTNRALAMALDGNGRWCYLDPKLGAMHAVAEAARNVACTGARPVAATNCLNFGNPEKPGTMWQFAQVIDGITKACEELETPITGGNVSFYNETLGEGIWPTPVIGVVGILDDVHRATQPHFVFHEAQEAGRAILLLRGSEPGDATDVEQEFGSSEYAKQVLGKIWGFPPALEIEREHALQRAMVKLIRDGLVESAHDCSEGGVAVTIAEAAFGNGVGATVNLSSNALPYAAVLFAEDASRIVISCDEKNVQAIQNTALEYGVAADLLGHTANEQLSITIDGQPVVRAKVSELKAIWESALDRALHAGTD
ncbi:MAG: phosphoribosylformylglycinamidine synthase subunit PurL [Candidatus Koribacter versatilis]|uniref:Phosphoribosylformylglycinamidine synthase subunit PurL n=1 Tax=Candidatus Korobacter versatilis TaxID=658062 RepID=A0A932A9A5_9BACT|nr:phosphoribosylformylglycinamidine synthase subunit PurL [Candidatus Koribacter versatilis]